MRPSGAYNTNYAQYLAIVHTRLQWGLLLFRPFLVVVFPLNPAYLICLLELLKSVPILGKMNEYNRQIAFAIVTSLTAIAVLGLQSMYGYMAMQDRLASAMWPL
ncbi:MAG: hypothetical protein QGH66_02940 [Dehalococcoidia bacterium]|nr:hypothetical protein [Dehalococcoidia bacterium]MDP7470046.1 hypothetical protein [Dehalococcoidia bacterium]